MFHIGRRDIQALRVKCESDCDWEGTVATVEQHVEICMFAKVPCPKECKETDGTVKKVRRRDVDSHQRDACPRRDFECRSCGEKGTYERITRVHYRLCGHRVVPCPNTDCSRSMQRRRVRRHLENCVYTRLTCKYEKLGCDVKLRRNALSAHENEDSLHLRMALNTVVKMEENIECMQETVDEGSGTIEELEGNVQELEETVEELKETNRELKAKSQTLKRNEVLTFALPDYHERKEAGAVYESSEFYTHPRGYCVSVQVYANGLDDAEGNHVSVYASIEEGEYDDELKWPFVGLIAIQLLNQLEDKKHIVSAISYTIDDDVHANDGWGLPTFASHDILGEDPVRNTQYLMDDTLYFQVAVELADHKPWLDCTAK